MPEPECLDGLCESLQGIDAIVESIIKKRLATLRLRDAWSSYGCPLHIATTASRRMRRVVRTSRGTVGFVGGKTGTERIVDDAQSVRTSVLPLVRMAESDSEPRMMRICFTCAPDGRYCMCGIESANCEKQMSICSKSR